MTDPFLTHEERREILRDYGNRFGLRAFVETGTANGDTCAALMTDFDALWTIEIDDGMFTDACQRFVGTNVHCVFGDSAMKLSDVLAWGLPPRTPALFWLDGHACGGARGDKDTPIIEELGAIFHAVEVTDAPHVILIDDARLFGGMPYYGEWDWPHIDEIRALADEAGYGFHVADDIIRLTPGPQAQ